MKTRGSMFLVDISSEWAAHTKFKDTFLFATLLELMVEQDSITLRTLNVYILNANSPNSIKCFLIVSAQLCFRLTTQLEVNGRLSRDSLEEKRCFLSFDK